MFLRFAVEHVSISKLLRYVTEMAISEGCFLGEQMTLLEHFCCWNGSCIEEALPRVYTITRLITYRFNSKTQKQLFHFTAAILVSLRGTPTGRLRTKLYKFG